MKYCYNKLQKTPEIISKFYYSASESSIRFYNNIMYALRKLTWNEHAQNEIKTSQEQLDSFVFISSYLCFILCDCGML